MFDLKLTKNGDLELTDTGDITTTESVCQAVRIRLLWFFDEWRLGPDMGFKYFEYVFVKNPSYSMIRHLIREAILDVDEVTSVGDIDISVNSKTREATIEVEFSTDEDTFREEVNIEWQTTD
ncbi:MAG: hypothetical protein LIO94_09530 [Clostridiales bacterium]|nr:hypothetical protein [Clostridiales bacterium]